MRYYPMRTEETQRDMRTLGAWNAVQAVASALVVNSDVAQVALVPHAAPLALASTAFTLALCTVGSIVVRPLAIVHLARYLAGQNHVPQRDSEGHFFTNVTESEYRNLIQHERRAVRRAAVMTSLAIFATAVAFNPSIRLSQNVPPAASSSPVASPQ